ncbi:F-box and leucine-rich repeat protein 13 [Tautogolabrus adspersus]
MDLTKERYVRKRQQAALTKLSNWVKLHKETQAVAISKLERVVNAGHLKRIIASWHNVVKDSKRTRGDLEIWQGIEMGSNENPNRVQETGKGCDELLILPSCLLLKEFTYSCTGSPVCSGGERHSKPECRTPGCRRSQSLCVAEWEEQEEQGGYKERGGACRNLQELNMSECVNVTDKIVQRIVEACPCLLYLNLSCTHITNKSLRELSRNCVNLQYLSLAYCYRFTDNGFMYLSTGTGCRNLIHLDLSGCTQMTVNGFSYISAGCPSLREIVINDMITLSDSCVLALIARCRCLSAISLLDAPHLSDIAFKAIAEVAKLKSFSTEGNNQITDISLKALCSSSPGLCRLHAAECPRLTDTSLTSVATLKNLQHLDISVCYKVSDYGIMCLTEGSSSNQLRELDVSHCSNITDESVRRIAQRLCKLYHLNLSHCEKLTDRSLEWLSGSSICSLDVTGCNIQDQGLAALQEIHLKKLDLAECVCITDIGIEKLCKNARDLEHVDVSHCVALSESAIRAISFYCRGLVTLRMSGCPKMTDMAVQYLTSGSQYLQKLDVSGCVLLTDRSLRHLERICPPLCSITMVCCSSISKEAALKLQPRVAYWEHSNDDSTY